MQRPDMCKSPQSMQCRVRDRSCDCDITELGEIRGTGIELVAIARRVHKLDIHDRTRGDLPVLQRGPPVMPYTTMR